MNDHTNSITNSLDRQRAIRARCTHPSNNFDEFKKEAIEQSIPQRFEQQVRRYPERIAVKTWSQQLTYEGLNRAANRVAHAVLATHGEGTLPAALLCEEWPLLIGMLGALKAGKVKVPLDPSAPRARLASILEDSQASILVTHTEHLGLARELARDRCPVINMDDLDRGLSTENPGLSISPDAYAHIMYTSGSTGQPKGVVWDHRRLLHLAMRRTHHFGICPRDRVLVIAQNANNLFQPLLNGAAVHLPHTKRDGFARVADWLIQEATTMYWTTPSAFRHFAATLTGTEQFPHLRLIRLGSEPVLRTDVDLYKKHFADHCILVNGLGSTETANFCHYFVDKQTEIPGALVPAGYVAEETQIWLLDEQGQPVGDEESGEIAVQCRYLALGYWRRPELTQAAFQPTPDGSGERVYHTGDLGRRLPGGCLLHLGRKDFQVKIRGNRVEIAEIEAALLEIEAVEQAVVIDREDLPGEKRLVAYFVPQGPHPPTVTALRRILATKLPDYMLPSTFVKMASLPVTGSGKIDRRALPTPGSARPDLEVPYVAPRTPVEEVVAGLWQQRLGIERVGIHDSFLELGGNSLMATQLIARIQQTFEVEFPLRAFLEAPTVAGLAAALAHYETAPGRALAVARLRRQIAGMSAEQIDGMLQTRKKPRGMVAEP